MKRLPVSLFLLSLAFVSSGVFAAETVTPPTGTHWVYYAYGNATAVAELFKALTMIAGTTSFKSLCVALALGGFAASGAAGMISGNPTKFFGYIIGLFIFVYAIFGAKMDIYISETIHVPGTGASGFKMAENVPLAVGLPMVVISQVGHGVSDLFNTYMTSPEGPGLSEANGTLPFGAGMGIAKDMAELRIANPYLRKNFNEWAKDCLAPRVYSLEIPMFHIINSPDIMGQLKTTKAATSESQFFKMTHLDGTLNNASPHDSANLIKNFHGVVNCKEGFGILEKQLAASVKTSMQGIGAQLSPQIVTGVLDADKAGDIAKSVAGAAMGDATKMATQSAVIDLMSGASSYQAQVLGNNEALLALNLNNAQRSQKTGWYTASVLFRDMGGYFFAILQVFLIGVTPMVAAMMFIPGMGAKLGGSYIKACIWLASWWPALQIVNYIMELYYQASAGAVYGPAGGLTMANTGLASQFNDNMIIAAGFMATLVPTVMWGIINGAGYALTSVLDRAAGSNYASSAAQDAAAGNFRAGNIGMNSFSANKFDSTTAFSTGSKAAEAHYGTGASYQHVMRGGSTVHQNSGHVTEVDTTEASNALNTAMSNEKQTGQSFTHTASSSITKAGADLESHGSSFSVSDDGKTATLSNFDVNRSLATTGQMTQGFQRLWDQGHKEEAIQSLATSMGVSSGQVSNMIKMGASIDFKNSEGISTGFKMSFDQNNGLTLQDSTGSSVSSQQQIARGETSQTGKNGVSQTTYSETTATTKAYQKQEEHKEAQKEVITAQENLKAARQASLPQGMTQERMHEIQGEHSQITSASEQERERIGKEIDKNKTPEKAKKEIALGENFLTGDPEVIGDTGLKGAVANEQDALRTVANNNLTNAGDTTTADLKDLELTNTKSRLNTINKNNLQAYDDNINAAQAVLDGFEQRKGDKVEQYKYLEGYISGALTGGVDFLNQATGGTAAATKLLDAITGTTVEERGEKWAAAKGIASDDLISVNNASQLVADMGYANISGFKYGDTVYTPSGVIGGFGDGEYAEAKMVYRTGESKDDAKYYTVTNDGMLQEISVDDPASGKKDLGTGEYNPSSFTQGAVNMFDTRKQVGGEQVPVTVTKDNGKEFTYTRTVGGETVEGQHSSLGANIQTALGNSYHDITPTRKNNVGGNSTDDSKVHAGGSRMATAKEMASGGYGDLVMKGADNNLKLRQEHYNTAVREAAKEGNLYALNAFRNLDDRNEALDVRTAPREFKPARGVQQ